MKNPALRASLHDLADLAADTDATFGAERTETGEIIVKMTFSKDASDDIVKAMETAFGTKK